MDECGWMWMETHRVLLKTTTRPQAWLQNEDDDDDDDDDDDG